MKFKPRTLRALAEMVVGDAQHFRYRSSSRITEFFEDCDLDFRHDGSTRWWWTSERLAELLNDPPPAPNVLPAGFVRVMRTLLDKADAQDGDPDRAKALSAVNTELQREGYAAFYDDHGVAHIRHIATDTVSETANPHRPFTPAEVKRREQLAAYLEKCSEDDLINEVLLPLFRQLGFHRITAAGHKDKALEYGKDIWMRYTLPTQHVLYFGIQAKKGKLDASGTSTANIGEVHNQATMMLGHEIFDPELSRRVLVDHAFIIAGGEITKAARNWLGGKLDQSRRSQIMFMDRDDILNLFAVANVPLPPGASSATDDALSDEIPF
ncbi:MAG TPA: hypothetical protein VMA53_07595 [Stellaceae bacterium]|nr:hypothetical protein [Stellaceae bacterium]